MLVKIVTIFLILMAALAVFGRLRFPSLRTKLSRRGKCPACGRPLIGKGDCPCGGRRRG